MSIAAVDEEGRNQFEILEPGDVWYFPKGEGHAIQGLDENNEFLLCFDEGDFEAPGTTFHLDDWIIHTPKDILARNFGVNESVFDDLPETNPYIQNATVNMEDIDHPFGELEGNMSYVYKASKVPATEAAGGGGSFKIFDTSNFPISTTIAGAIFELKPGGLRELHWHPNVSICRFQLKESVADLFPLCRRRSGCTSTKARRERACTWEEPVRGRLISR